MRSALAQQHGLVHGGVVAYVADSAIAFAGGSVLGPSVATGGLSLQYVRPARGSELRAVAEVVTTTRSQAVCRCEVLVTGDDGVTLCAVAQGTVRLLHDIPDPHTTQKGSSHSMNVSVRAMERAPDPVRSVSWAFRSRASSPSEPPRTPTSSWTSSRAPIRWPRSPCSRTWPSARPRWARPTSWWASAPRSGRGSPPARCPKGSPASRRTWSEPTASRCPPPSTTWRSGSRRRRTTWSSTRPWTPWGSWRRTPRWPASSGAGPTTGTATSPASRTAPRTRPSRARPATPWSRTAPPAPAARCGCSSSGHTTREPGTPWTTQPRPT